MSEPMYAKLSVRIFTDRKCFGPGVAELLHRVERLHSLRAAAQSMEMAYSKAWTVIHNAEEGLGFKLLHSSTGGKGGGGAAVTAQGRRMLEAYEAYCEKLRVYGAEQFAQIFDFYGKTEDSAP